MQRPEVRKSGSQKAIINLRLIFAVTYYLPDFPPYAGFRTTITLSYQ
jgi:hypothetical protein